MKTSSTGRCGIWARRTGDLSRFTICNRPQDPLLRRGAREIFIPIIFWPKTGPGTNGLASLACRSFKRDRAAVLLPEFAATIMVPAQFWWPSRVACLCVGGTSFAGKTVLIFREVAQGPNTWPSHSLAVSTAVFTSPRLAPFPLGALQFFEARALGSCPMEKRFANMVLP